MGLKRKKTPDTDTEPKLDKSLQEARSLQLSALKKNEIACDIYNYRASSWLKTTKFHLSI